MTTSAQIIGILSLGLQVALCSSVAEWREDGYHVYPGGNIQEGLDEAARHSNKVVKVHAGTYRPQAKGQALVWFNRAHNGIRLEAVGEVTLTAANAQLSETGSPSHPAVVNHVVYFGDGISGQTVLQGFKITGANHFVTTQAPDIEPNGELVKNLFFYSDGGAVKVFGDSCPTLRQLEIVDNFASPCAGGISVQQQQRSSSAQVQPVRIEDCIFRQNRSQVTGAAVDLLPGSSAVLSNCLFVGNIANLGVNYISQDKTHPEFTNSAPLTVFPTSKAVLQHCTFTENRNAVEDLGKGSLYQNCVFWRNNLGGAFYGGERYELDVEDGAEVNGCFFGGQVIDPRAVVSRSKNIFNAPDPKFDSEFKATEPTYRTAGFRPVLRTTR